LQGELDESLAPHASASLYGCAKWLEERLGARYATLRGFRFTALRYCAVFGPGEATSAGMAQVRNRIESTRLGAPVTIAEASGDEKAQLTYVSDAVDATLALMSASALRHTEYNIAGPRENYLSLRDYHAQIASLFPRTADVTFAGRAKSGGLPRIDRLMQDTGFVPSIRVIDGLRRMYAAEL
jgi:nucleoside-diphosphate-sugar epimerase